MTYLDAIKADIAYYKELREATHSVLDRLEIEVKILELEEKLMMADSTLVRGVGKGDGI